jgi:hypothetical protein
MSNEERRLVRHHIGRLLSEMTDDQLRSLLRRIKDGSEQHDVVWRMIEDAEDDARADMIRNLTKRMVELSDIDREHRLGNLFGEHGLFEREPEIPTPWPH